MRKKTKQLVITFSTTTAAMAMEKRAQEMGISGRLIPLPSEISAGCGLSWCALPGEEDAIREEMKKVGIEEEALHQVMV